MSFWRTLGQTVAKNPISLFAVLCVAGTAIFLALTADRMLTVLESPAWCGRAIQAERISDATGFKGLEGCTELLKIQLSAVADGFSDAVRIFGLALLVLVIVVVAGARANFKAGKDGIEADVSRHDAAAAAQETAEAAVDKADEIAGDT